MKPLLKEFVPGLMVVAAMLIGNKVYGGCLPAEVPIHFNVHGQADRYAAASTFVWIIPALFVGLMGVVSLLLRLSPRSLTMPNSRVLLGQMYLGLGLLLAGIHFGTLMDATGGEVFTKCVLVGGALFLIMFGNVLAKSERNFFVGLRLPWTIVSDDNWSATHRLTGWLMVLAGLGLGVTAFVYPSMKLFLLGITVPVIVGCIFSFFHFWMRDRNAASD